ncbi:hypothetical protein BD408DRAFT_423684 [Parasitella parasitica]|nr:hypothetical protein BD408DRAFT_423684 [Parasitella parasitica]
MSAFNNNNTSVNNAGVDPTRRPNAGQLNENHGIAATGLNEPHTHATVPATQGTTAERRSDHLNYSGAPIAANKVDQASTQHPSSTNYAAGTGIPPVNNSEHTRENAMSGSHNVQNPSPTNRTAATGIPPVNTAEHARENALSGSHNVQNPSSTNRTAATGIPPVNTAEHARQNAAQEALSGHNGHHHNAGTGVGSHGSATAAAGAGHAAADRLSDNNHRDGNHHIDSHTSAVKGDHGASHHTDHHIPGVTGTTGMRHAGEPQHDGLLPNKKHNHLDDNTTSGAHPATSDGVEGKPSAGDKIKGNLEKMAGKISGNEAKVIAGENKAAGRT